MSPSVPAPPPALAERARSIVARVRPGALHARRPLPIRADRAAIEALWADPRAREAVLAGLPVRDAQIAIGDDQGEWGLTVWVTVALSAPLPRVQAQAQAGTAVRRLKSLAETGEVPTTDHNPSARPDAGQEARS
jgi:hypothetical protein